MKIALVVAALLASGVALAQTVKVGSTLALTGPLGDEGAAAVLGADQPLLIEAGVDGADRVGVDAGHLGEVERGEKSISIDSLYRVSVALEVLLRHLTDVRPLLAGRKT